jgi:hypothetical protein
VRDAAAILKLTPPRHRSEGEVLLTQHFPLGLAPVLDKRVEQWVRRSVEAARRDQVVADLTSSQEDRL